MIDFADLAYISSAGLRVILSAQIIMNRQGNMVVCNVNEDMMEVFEVTGGNFRYFAPLYVVVAKFHGYGIIWHEEES